jgi:hypothetical protein
MGRTLKQIQGDTKTFTVTVYDSDGSLYDLTGYTVRFTVKDDKDTVDGSASISKTGNVTDAENGVFTVSLTNTDTNITAGIYYYDFQIDNGSSIVKTVESGIFQVVQDVTDMSY